MSIKGSSRGSASCLALCLVMAFSFTGCAMMDALFGCKPFHLEGVDTLAIVQLDIEKGSEVQLKTAGLDLAEELSQAIVDRDEFQVVERKKIEQALFEMHLNVKDIFTGDGADKLGNFVEAEALIVGRVRRFKYEEDKLSRKPFKRKPYFFGLFGDERDHVQVTRRGRATVAATFRVIDVKTCTLLGEVVCEPDSITVRETAVDEDPGSIDKDALFRDLREEIIRKVARAIRKPRDRT